MKTKSTGPPREVVVATRLIFGSIVLNLLIPIVAGVSFQNAANPSNILWLGLLMLLALLIHTGKQWALTTLLLLTAFSIFPMLFLALLLSEYIPFVLCAPSGMRVAALLLLYRPGAREWFIVTPPKSLPCHGNETSDGAGPPGKSGRSSAWCTPRRPLTRSELILFASLFLMVVVGMAFALLMSKDGGFDVFFWTWFVAMPLWLGAIGVGTAGFILPWYKKTQLIMLISGVLTGPTAFLLFMLLEPAVDSLVMRA